MTLDWQIHSTPTETYINSIRGWQIHSTLTETYIVCEVNATTLGWQIHSTPTETYIM